MRGFHHISAWMLCAALAAAAGVCPAQAAELDGVRVSTQPSRTRAVIDLSGPVKYKLFQLSDPGRVVLDFSDSALAHDFAAPDDKGLLKDVRTGRHGKHGVRVVLDLAGKAHPKSFLLEPEGKHGYRLVVDLYADGDGDGDADAVAASSKRQSAERAARLLQGARKVIVAVDAGHGGVDPGAHGPGGTREKDVTLDVAKDLARLIDKQPGMTAILTRKGDYYVGLKERRVIARKHNADLFISIHADAFTDPDAKGSSVWVLSTHGKVSEAARWLANSQNHSGLLGGVSLDDKSDALASVLLDLQQGYAIHASKRVANNVFAQLAALGPTHRDHIERANFVVLRSPDIPSILVETAFITNPAGERKLQSAAYQKKLAGAVLRGVETYFTKTPPPGTWFAMKARQRRGELATAGKAHGDVYKVTRGDTLSSIASRYGVSVNDLKSANDMSGNMVQVGAVLTIPGS